MGFQVSGGKPSATLLSYFRRNDFQVADVGDLAQDTLMKALAGIGSLRDEAWFLGWLFQIARNVQLRARKSALRQVRTDGGDTETAAVSQLPYRRQSPLDASIDGERFERIWQASEKLPHRQKQCLILRVMHDTSYEEIATLMRLNARTVRNHIREARVILRKGIDEEVRIENFQDGTGTSRSLPDL